MSARLSPQPRVVRAPPSGPERAAVWSRQIAAELGAVLLDTLGLAAALEWHAHQFQKYTGIRSVLTVDETAGFVVPEEYATGLFEMLHDALNHVARCAQVRRVEVRLHITPRDVGMVMRHDGIGGAGALAQIRWRAQAYRGRCEVSRARGTGTTLAVSLPLPSAP